MISMNNIVKKLDSQTVLSEVSFEAKQGEIFGLLRFAPMVAQFNERVLLL